MAAYRATPEHSRIIDRGSGLANGLKLYIPGNEGAGNTRDLAQRRAVTTASGVAWKGTELGVLLDLGVSAASQYVSTAYTSPGATGPVSIACWYEPAGVGTATAGFLSWASTATSGTPYVIFQNNSGNLRIFWAGGYRLDLTSALSAGTPIHICLSFDGGTATFYVNGRNRGTYTASATNHTAPTLYVGSGFNAPTNCRIGDVGVWTRALSAAEVYELYRTPFRLLRRRDWWMTPAAAPGGTGITSARLVGRGGGLAGVGGLAA